MPGKMSVILLGTGASFRFFRKKNVEAKPSEGADRILGLRDEILAECPEAQVEGKVGRSGSFEVTINGKEVFSKLKQGGFPVCDEVVNSVIEACKGLDPPHVEEVDKSGCSIQ
ncbi:predicted protein [Nematostella vectensis]|uniref:Migration and invasion enhancer 1 n=1 Tax=Nematostella vectensis TaxID=45351 RepID=A7RUC6_NEMVE|nr:predicted protein [Nematostella vectensis]|eukprot:XP_001637116.1 predicted protein [Nematostella vectensis]